MGANDPQGWAIFDHRGMVGRIYKENHYTLLHIGFEEDFFFMLFPIRPRGGACMDPRGMVGRIYKEDHYTFATHKVWKLWALRFWRFSYVFPIVSLWELSVAMETRVLIRPGQNLMQPFPHPNDTSDTIWLQLAD